MTFGAFEQGRMHGMSKGGIPGFFNLECNIYSGFMTLLAITLDTEHGGAVMAAPA